MKTGKIILYSLLASLLVTASVAAGVLRRVDTLVQDAVFQRSGVTTPEIVLIGIDELALDTYGPYNTWDRNIMASALEVLAADPDKKPAAVAVDVLYTGSSSQQADERLAEAAEKLGCVITASMAEFGERLDWTDNQAGSLNPSALLEYVEPYEQLKACTVQGHINAMADTDGVLRHALLYVDLPDGRRVNSLAYESAAAYCSFHSRQMKIPETGEGGFFYVPYTAKPGGYDDGVSLTMLIGGEITPDFWAGKIVLIGPYAPALQDVYFTPIDWAEQMYGIEIHANVIQSILEGNYKQESKDAPQLIILFFLCALAMAAFLKLSVAKGGAVCAGLIILGVCIPILIYHLGFVTHPLWLSACSLILYVAALVAHYVSASREKRALALEKERVDTELRLAARIQENALIREFPAFPDRREFDLFADMKPAREVGGDLYDFFMLDDDHLALVIADVSGKGIPASLFMMVAMTLIRHVAMRESSPARTLEIVNREICARNPEGMFVTVWIGVLEISTGKLTCCNGGHEYPALKNPDGSFALYKDKHSFVIGAEESIRYKEYELALEPGSKLFVYSDGVPESTDSNEELFGTDRMITALQLAENGTPEEILSSVHAAINRFVGEAPQFDDLTMLCLQYNGIS